MFGRLLDQERPQAGRGVHQADGEAAPLMRGGRRDRRRRQRWDDRGLRALGTVTGLGRAWPRCIDRVFPHCRNRADGGRTCRHIIAAAGTDCTWRAKEHSEDGDGPPGEPQQTLWRRKCHQRQRQSEATGRVPIVEVNRPRSHVQQKSWNSRWSWRHRWAHALIPPRCVLVFRGAGWYSRRAETVRRQRGMP